MHPINPLDISNQAKYILTSNKEYIKWASTFDLVPKYSFQCQEWGLRQAL